MLGALEARVDVVVAQVPQLVGADGKTAARADHFIAALDAPCELRSTATVDGAIELALAGVLLPAAPRLGLSKKTAYQAVSIDVSTLWIRGTLCTWRS